MAEKSTKEFVEIQDIKDDLIILKDGSFRQIIEVGSINFELKSQDEQMAILQKFKEFLNSLDFSLEIVVMSRRLNIKNYLKTLEEIKEKQPTELLRVQVAEYSRFIKGLTELSNIMNKRFFVVVSWHFLLTETQKGILNSIKSIIKPREAIKKLTDEEIKFYRNQIYQRTQMVIDGLSSLGLTPRVLEKEDMVNIFYKLYNPGASEELTLK